MFAKKTFCVIGFSKTNSLSVVQRHFRIHSRKSPPNKLSMTGTRILKQQDVYVKIKVLGKHWHLKNKLTL